MERRASLVLLYTDRDEAVDPLGMCVSPEHFEEQVEVMARVAEVVPARSIATAPPGSVAITFDDGYADVFSEALPRLGRHGMASTVFLVTDALSSGRPFWWIGWVAAVFAAGRWEPVSVPLGGKRRRFNLRSRLSQRIALRVLFPRLRGMREDEREKTLAELEHRSEDK